MIEMYGFNPKATEARWQQRLSAKTVTTTTDLFLLSYDIMRLYFSALKPGSSGEQILTLGQDREIDLLHQDFPTQPLDYIIISAHRGFLTEALCLPRRLKTNIVEEPRLTIKNYTSALLQRTLDESNDDEPVSLIVPDDLDIMNTSTSVWRARAFITP